MLTAEVVLLTNGAEEVSGTGTVLPVPVTMGAVVETTELVELTNGADAVLGSGTVLPEGTKLLVVLTGGT